LAAGFSWQVLLHLGEVAADFFEGVMVSNAHAEKVTITTAAKRMICFFINTYLREFDEGRRKMLHLKEQFVEISKTCNRLRIKEAPNPLTFVA
jgi:tRNA(Phe) wybutosine-synthesizing methylase Tyw3